MLGMGDRFLFFIMRTKKIQNYYYAFSEKFCGKYTYWCLPWSNAAYPKVMVLTGLKEEEVEVVITQKAGQARQENVSCDIFLKECSEE